jgi:hypothetical protein
MTVKRILRPVRKVSWRTVPNPTVVKTVIVK